jgi:uncharacterized membrane protein (UPF0127 family)
LPYKHALTSTSLWLPGQGHKLPLRQFIALLLLILLTLSGESRAAPTIELTLGSRVYQVELAMTSAERQQGLMYRPRLARRQGMLLVYQQADDYRIWMKNMLIPLRVYWIDAELTVIGIQRLEPCEYSPCPVYSVERESMYILELSDYDHPLAVGDRLIGIRLE